MPPKKLASCMSSEDVQKLVQDSIATALAAERTSVAAEAARAAEAAAAEAARLALVANGVRTPEGRKCSYKDFKNCQPTNFKGSEGAVAMTRWFEKSESVFLLSNCPDECKVKYATGTLMDDALSWWNAYAQPIGIENAYKLSWDEFKKMMTKKYCPRTEVKKLETEFYNLVTIGLDLKTYIRRFQELAVLCPAMVADKEKLMEKLYRRITGVHSGQCNIIRSADS